MNRNVSILGVLAMMAVTVMATAAVAFAIPNEGSNGQLKVSICHKGHMITVGEPAVDAHKRHGDTVGTSCPGGAEPTPEPPDGITLTTDATDSVPLGQPISDTATLSGATSDATGTITFSVYGPFTDEDPTTDVCDETTLADESDPVAIGSPDPTTGDYVVSSDDPADTTDGFVPSEVGRYQWIASYSGDDSNDPVTSPCKAANEQSVVEGEESTIATEQLTTLALDHKEQRLLEIKEKLRDDETPRKQKEALQERRKELRGELYG